jgi:enoyl-CoA hydratase
MSEALVLTEIHGSGRLKVGVVTLNRPQVLNALNDDLMTELGQVLLQWDQDDSIGCMILTGGDKVFAAGADIAAMKDFDFADVYASGFITRNWEALRQVRKPVIAVVQGLALGGGCELAMMCDMIFAAETAKFGQPEITIGVLAGAGATQRLPRAVGKAKAMDMLLTNRWIDAHEAERSGLVSRVLPSDQVWAEALAAADKICSWGRLAAMATKEAVQASFETPLSEGLRLERRLFHALFGTTDQREGMDAFVNKRKPRFNQHRSNSST